MHQDLKVFPSARCALALISSVFMLVPAPAKSQGESIGKSDTTAIPASQPRSSDTASSDGSNGKSAFAESFADLIEGKSATSASAGSNSASERTNQLRASRASQLPEAENGPTPQYGKPLADTLGQEQNLGAGSRETLSGSAPNADGQLSSGTSPNSGTGAAASTLAPFRTTGGGFASLHGIQLPRPINIPKNASPSLRQAAAEISNLSIVSPGLIRGAQPSSSALTLLKAAGVRTVVNLRNEDILVAREAADCKRAGLNYVNIPMALFETPSKSQFLKFLSVVDSSGPVFVHCQKGEDRTGTMVAVYRMSRENWDANRAYQEMTAMGFKTYLGSLSGAVFDYSASLGRPARRPAPDYSGFTSILKH